MAWPRSRNPAALDILRRHALTAEPSLSKCLLAVESCSSQRTLSGGFRSMQHQAKAAETGHASKSPSNVAGDLARDETLERRITASPKEPTANKSTRSPRGRCNQRMRCKPPVGKATISFCAWQHRMESTSILRHLSCSVHAWQFLLHRMGCTFFSPLPSGASHRRQTAPSFSVEVLSST